ncbi:bifunctional DNA primase/polymerase [Rhodococcus sp. IEGM1428]|uniref:bifunctional DNA primase/polymerase n=1 Tax=Rhodococcus sp. IEGM1428 TaxID=3392191 RepID=UPI003D14F92A
MSAWAHRYIRDGFEVVCLRPGSMCPQSARGVHSATRSHDVVTKLWSETPTANIGLRVPVGHVLLQVDTTQGGSVWHLKKLGATMSSKTAANTWEFLYKAPGLRLCPGNKEGSIRMQGRNAILVAEPSTLKSGGRYQWFDLRRPVAPPLSYFAELGLAVDLPECGPALKDHLHADAGSPMA